MAKLVLTGQLVAARRFTQVLEDFNRELEKRRSLWERLNAEQRQQWLAAGKDPLMAQAFALYQQLEGWFDGVVP